MRRSTTSRTSEGVRAGAAGAAAAEAKANGASRDAAPAAPRRSAARSEHGPPQPPDLAADAGKPAATSAPAAATAEVPPAFEVMDEEQRQVVGAMELRPGALSPSSEDKEKGVVWFDIDNTLYPGSTQIASMMAQRIRAYFLTLGLDEAEAEKLHQHYYKSYGLAIRGLVKHHRIDPLDYDRRCDASLPLDQVLRPDSETIALLRDIDRSKYRVWALTNAYKTHALRVLTLLKILPFFEGLIFCDYGNADFACKPEPRFYHAACSYVGTTPEHCWFVDDSALNIQSAKRLGWTNSVLYREEEGVDAVSAPPANGEFVPRELRAFNATAKLDALALSNGSAEHDADGVREQLQALAPAARVRLLGLLLESVSSPTELSAMARAVERHMRLRHDFVSSIGSSITLAIFSRLSVRELLRCRQVSKKWRELAAEPELWRSHALALTESDPSPLVAPATPDGWEPLVRGLYFRERNWARGISQRIVQMPGHTGFVTAMKLKGRTLITGSYDESIRIWDLPTARCIKVIKAKAIACLDFLPQQGVLAAGLYDTGRVMIWSLKTYELLHTFTGHNKGIRSLALSPKGVLVSVGQDKAINVWDWRTGEKRCRWGQQSNVSLGVAIVNDDQVVAVTVDAIIRTFSIRRKEMIGEYHISKLAGGGAKARELAGLGGDANMMLWFAAQRRTLTVASKDAIIHLEWQEHVVPVTDEPSPTTSRSGTPMRGAPGASALRSRKDAAESPLRSRRESQQGSTGAVGSPPNAAARARRDSTASNASVASNATAMTSATSRRSLGGAPTSARSPPSGNRSAAPLHPITRSTSLATPSRPQPAAVADQRRSARASGSPAPPPWPAPRNSPRHSLTTSPRLSSSASLSFPSPSPSSPSLSSLASWQAGVQSAASDEPRATRIEANLGAPPQLVDIIRGIPDAATGCVDPGKRRLVSASRFSSRAGADRRLYVSTLQTDGPDATPRRSTVPIGGAWQAEAEMLAQPAHNPLCIVHDADTLVVGTSSGLVYSIGFVGDEHSRGWIETDEGADDEMLRGTSAARQDVVISDLVQLRQVWSELFLPTDAPPDHPGRFKDDAPRDLIAAMGLT